MAENPGLVALFEREFTRLEKETKEPYQTVREMAAYLGVDKASLSRFRSGERTLSRQRARQFADRLRSAGQDREALYNELIAARPSDDDDRITVKQWFEARAAERFLMLVEFREPPALRPTTAKSGLTDVVARAVAGGLSYGMFFPFNLDGAEPDALPAPVKEYLGSLRRHVISTYTSIQTCILDNVSEERLDAGDGSLREELAKAVKRLRLYSLLRPQISACPAIGYRLFYVEEEEQAVVQRWEWISSHTAGEQMIRKDASEEELEATAIRFFPVVEYWRENRELPRSNEAMKEFADENAEYMEAYQLNRVEWEVLKGDKSAEAVVADYLKKKPRSSTSRSSQ